MTTILNPKKKEKTKKEKWFEEFAKRELLEDFCIFAQEEGYLDSDWYTEHPKLIDKFMEYIKTMIDRIKTGDWVDVYFENCAPIKASQVKYIPLVNGEVWVLEGFDGRLFEVQNFAYMERVAEPTVAGPPKSENQWL